MCANLCNQLATVKVSSKEFCSMTFDSSVSAPVFGVIFFFFMSGGGQQSPRTGKRNRCNTLDSAGVSGDLSAPAATQLLQPTSKSRQPRSSVSEVTGRWGGRGAEGEGGDTVAEQPGVLSETGAPSGFRRVFSSLRSSGK